MPHTSFHRRFALAICAAVVVPVCAGTTDHSSAASASRGGNHGRRVHARFDLSSPDHRSPFPSDRVRVGDPDQNTGRRVARPMPTGCVANASNCNDLTVLFASLRTVELSAQRASPPRRSTATSSVPRTSDGRPDLQGTWSFSTATPLERPPQFADQPWLSDEEAARYVAEMLSTRSTDIRDKDPRVDLGREVNEFWWERPNDMARIDGRAMSSLITDPPTGRVPWLVPPAPAGGEPANLADNPEDRSPGERCLADSAWIPMVGGAPANNHVQVVQTSTYVVLHGETVNTGRVIPFGRREHLPANLRWWRGDSIASWDGDTLVVDTINFRIGASLRGFGVGPGMGVRTEPEMHLIERFTLSDTDTLLYEFTVDNPKLFSRSWTARVPMARTEARLFEYACHEGNYGLENILRGARAEDKRR